jgi:glycosyltransferase involved in cell wall biosynthesis
MKIAFYAPMKSPDDAQPSGDRTIGRLLMAALNQANCDVCLASELRTWSGIPDSDQLSTFRRHAEHEAKTLIETYDASGTAWRPDIWFTYHCYYKAPDLVGPAVAGALGIPYVITEASYSARRADGTWSDWLAEARASITAADTIFSFTARDKRGLQDICAPQRLHGLAPFLDLDAFDGLPSPLPGSERDPAAPARLVTVAMMRRGAKLASYQLLAASLERLLSCSWHLDIIGDGVARADVAKAFAGLPSERLSWHGLLNSTDLRHVLAGGNLFAWPGIDEAFGMAYLEAQALGLPVAAIRTAGVPEVVHHDETGLLADNANPDEYAGCLERLIRDDALRARLSAGARTSVEAHHSLKAASTRLGDVLRTLI